MTAFGGLFGAAPAQAADTALVGGTVETQPSTPNLQAAIDAMVAATQHLNSMNNGTQAPSEPAEPVEPETPVAPVEPEAPSAPSVESPEVTLPEVDVPETDITVDEEEEDEILDSIDDATARNIISSAMNYIGVPYVWGGTTPAGFDCSGLVQYVFAQNGISLPRTTYDQIAVVSQVSLDSLQPGDLVFWGGQSPYHVGIYIGDGEYIHAPAPGQSVCVQSYDQYPFDTAGRVLA